MMDSCIGSVQEEEPMNWIQPALVYLRDVEKGGVFAPEATILVLNEAHVYIETAGIRSFSRAGIREAGERSRHPAPARPPACRHSQQTRQEARARCTLPAFAKVSSGPVTLKLPATFNKVVSPPFASTVPEALAREAPCRSIPRPWIVHRRPGWS
jgi:hypothetical protein